MKDSFINEYREVEVLSNKNLTIRKGNVKKEELYSHFTKEEMLDRLSKLPPDEHGMLFQFLWRTGVRITEALSIRRKDLDFDNLEITIKWLKNRKYETRRIPMHPSLKIPLWSFTAKLNAEDRLFPFTRQYADQLAKRYRFEHCHKIRHSFAVNFLRLSNDPLALQILMHLLGHQHINTTVLYLKVIPIQQKKAINDINFD